MWHLAERQNFGFPEAFLDSPSLHNMQTCANNAFHALANGTLRSGTQVKNEKNLPHLYAFVPPSPNPGIHEQITLMLQTQASLEERLEGVPLPAQAIDDIGARLHQRRLEHVREEREDAVERLILADLATRRDFAVLDASKELGEDGKVEDQWGGEERVLTFVEDVLERIRNSFYWHKGRLTITLRPPIKSSE